jgi:hypothetical protein
VGIVWILGAGFSKPLGGPLLGKMLSPEAERDLAVRYSNAPSLGDRYATAARFLYQYGRSGKKYAVKIPNGGATEGEDLWEDAEQYLDYLDTAAETLGPGRDRLVQILGLLNSDLQYKDVKAIAASGRRLLAAECCAFLVGAVPASERWSPYRRWLEHVATGEDILITFNYDTVVETVAEATKRQLRYTTKESRPSHTVKLHEQGSRREALDCDDSELAIAGPGPSKQNLSGGAFQPYWEQARAALRTAEAIVFVGYRFPPTDAEAREKLLGAIRENNQTYLPIYIVLGSDPGTSSPRLMALLEHALSWRQKMSMTVGPPRAGAIQFSILPQQLGAEDFFSVATREAILRPYEVTRP